MGRNTADACIFCGENPCACGKPAKKATPPKVKRVKPPTSSAVPPLPAVPVPTRPSLAGITRVRTKEDANLGRAITLFAERAMLHRDELVTHRNVIDLPGHVIDAMIWRQDNEQTVRRFSSEAGT